VATNVWVKAETRTRMVRIIIDRAPQSPDGTRDSDIALAMRP